jgi:hypothetical protein
LAQRKLFFSWDTSYSLQGFDENHYYDVAVLELTEDIDEADGSPIDLIPAGGRKLENNKQKKGGK